VHDWEYSRTHWDTLVRLNTHLILLVDRSRPHAGEEDLYGRHWPIAENCIATFAKKREGRAAKWALLVSAPDERWLTDEVNAVAQLDVVPQRPRYRYVTRYAIVGTGEEDLARAFVASDSAPDYVWASATSPEAALAAAPQRTLVVLVDLTRAAEVGEGLRREVPLDISGLAPNEVAFKEWERGGLLGVVIAAPTKDVLLRAITDFSSRRAVGEARRRLLDLRGVGTIAFEGPTTGPAGEMANSVLDGLRRMAAQQGGLNVVRAGEVQGPAPVTARLRVIECSGQRRYWVEVSSKQKKEVEGGQTKVRTVWTFEEWYKEEATAYARLEFVETQSGKVLLVTGAGDWSSDAGMVRSERIEREGTERPSMPFTPHTEIGQAEASFVARLARAVGGPLPARLINNIIWR